MINLKKVLTGIISLLKPLIDHDRQLRMVYGTFNTTGNLTAYQTNYKISQFGGATLYNDRSHQDYSLGILDTTGFTVRKAGIYYVTVSGHINASTTNFSIRVQIINTRGSTAVSTITQYAFDPSANTVGWAPFFCSATIAVQPGDVISPFFYKYTPNNTTLGFRPSNVYMTIIYMGDTIS